LPPEKVMTVLAAYQELALEIIQEEGGRVDKFLGDGILATFGAVMPSSTYAADAVRTSRRLVTEIAAQQSRFTKAGWPELLRVGTAVAAGSIMVGTVGSTDRLEFTVIGDAVNRAAKLEDANKHQRSAALTDGKTYALAREQGYTGPEAEQRPAVLVPGLGNPVDLVVLA
ncbi:MAG: adenylate/guanylate cyclase domain-containing protein, partial [Roseibium sp.]